MANLSNINNKFLVTTGGNVLIGQTAAVGSSIFQVTGNSTFAGNVFLPDNKYATFGGANNAWELQIGVVGDNAFIEKTATTNGNLYIKNNGSGKGIIFQNGGATALTLDDNQNATFTGTVTAPNLNLTSLTQNTTSSLFLVKDEVLGAELVTNGDFDTATGWTAQSGWAVSSGKANGTATTGAIYQGIASMTASTQYRLTYTISGLTAGSVRVSLRAAVTTTQTTNGTFSEIVTSGTSSDTNFYIDGVAAFTGSIDNISLKQVTSSSDSVQERSLSSGAFGDELWAVTPTDSDNIYNLNSGNVGIGTTNPAQNFVVSNSTNGQGVEIIPGTTGTIQAYNRGASVYVPLNIDTLEARVRSIGATVFNNGSGFSESMRILSGGNVGIGTTNPIAKLHVTDTSFPQVRINDETNAGESGIRFRSYNGTTNDIHGDIFVDASSGTEVGRMGFRIPWNGTEKMTILSSGNVGIGTTTPARKFVVSNGGASGIEIKPNYVAGVNEILSFDRTGAGAYETMRFNGGDFEFQIDGTTRVVIDDNGDVGIGVTGPTEKLHVVGSQLITGGIATSVSGEALRVSNPGGASWGHQTSPTGAIKITLPQSWTNTMMRMTVKIYEYAADESFEVELGGYNVSGGGGYWVNTFAHIISSAAVDRNFTVRFGHDGTYCSIYIGELTSSWTYPQVAVTNFEAGFSQYDADKWVDGWDIGTVTSFGTISSTETSTQVTNWARNGQDLYYGSGTGNVGIGTTSPGTLHGVSYGTTKLHVDGGTDRGQMIIEGDSFAGIVLSDNGTTANERVFATSVDDGKYTIKPLNDNGTSTAGGVAVTVLHGGNVGIGTTTPSSKLHVQSDGSADVVFKLDNTNVADTAGAQIQLICDSAGSGDGNGALRHSIRSEFSGAINWEIHSGASHGDLNFSTLDSFAMMIDEEQRVGIGTTFPTGKLTVETTGNHIHIRNSSAASGRYWNFDPDSNSRLYVISNTGTGVYIDYASTSWSSTSDESIKENIKPLENVLDKIKDYKCIEYNLINDETKGKKIGFIAQDWKEDYPQIVDKDDEGLLGMKYTETIPVLLKAIQELTARVKVLENK